MATTTKGKLFYAEAVKGYTLKVMIDSLALTMSRTNFRVTKDGFKHRATDEAQQILFDIDFPRENFRPYMCRKEIIFSLNLKHLQKMVRNIKKKDSIIIFIDEKIPHKLALAIRPSGSTSGYNSRLETVYITINHIEIPDPPLDLPDVYSDEDGNKVNVYGYPKVIDSTDFQKIKKMTTVGKTVLVEMQKSNYISFYSDNGELYSSKLEFGEVLEHPESEDESEDDENGSSDENKGGKSEDESSEESSEDDSNDKIKGWYEAEFEMSVFNLLMKLPGLCSQMKFYSPRIERYPLKIGMNAGNLGSISVYIKDKTQIAIEQTHRDQVQADEMIHQKNTRRKR